MSFGFSGLMGGFGDRECGAGLDPEWVDWLGEVPVPVADTRGPPEKPVRRTTRPAPTSPTMMRNRVVPAVTRSSYPRVRRADPGCPRGGGGGATRGVDEVDGRAWGRTREPLAGRSAGSATVGSEPARSRSGRGSGLPWGLARSTSLARNPGSRGLAPRARLASPPAKTCRSCGAEASNPHRRFKHPTVIEIEVGVPSGETMPGRANRRRRSEVVGGEERGPDEIRWVAQLNMPHSLAARLNGLGDVDEIGGAI